MGGGVVLLKGKKGPKTKFLPLKKSGGPPVNIMGQGSKRGQTILPGGKT